MIDFCGTKAAGAAGQEKRWVLYRVAAASSDERRAHLRANSEHNTDIATDRDRSGASGSFTEGGTRKMQAKIPSGKNHETGLVRITQTRSSDGTRTRRRFWTLSKTRRVLVVQRSIRSDPNTAKPSSETRSTVGDGVKLWNHEPQNPIHYSQAPAPPADPQADRPRHCVDNIGWLEYTRDK